jgi:hypothetical protein
MAWSPGSWVSNSRTAGGTAGRSTVRFARRLRPRSTCWKGCWRTNAQLVARRTPSWLDAAARSTSWNEGCFGARAPAKWSTRPGCNFRFRPAGTTTCCVLWSTSGPPGIPRPAGGRSHPVAPSQTAARRHVAAGEHPSRQGPLHAGGRRWSAQPLEHATGAACPQLVRVIVRRAVRACENLTSVESGSVRRERSSREA